MKPSNKLRQVEKVRPDDGSQTLSHLGGEVGTDTLTYRNSGCPPQSQAIPGDRHTDLQELRLSPTVPGYPRGQGIHGKPLANKLFEMKEPHTSNNYDLQWPKSDSLHSWHH